MSPMAFADVDEVARALARHDYLADRGLASAVFLAVRMGRPLLLGAARVDAEAGRATLGWAVKTREDLARAEVALPGLVDA